jgi:sugar phosphate isomerase/epimerase
MTRRAFLAASAAAAVAGAAPSAPAVCVFSKPLDERSDADLARIAQEVGADGVDLTVRGNGHVKPPRVAEDLPRAVEAIRARGLAVPMITTELTSAADPARAILSAAARLKIPYFKLGYWMWKPNDAIDRRLAQIHKDLAALTALAQEHGVVAGYHNHSGDYVGEAVWDIRELLRGLDPRWVGYYFDAAHATIEGGLGGWDITERIAVAQLKMVAVKDFYWEKRNGRWDVRWCPLGEGMVDWKKALARLAGFTGPISIHVEYEPADVTAALAHDVAFLRKQLG